MKQQKKRKQIKLLLNQQMTDRTPPLPLPIVEHKDIHDVKLEVSAAKGERESFTTGNVDSVNEQQQQQESGSADGGLEDLSEDPMLTQFLNTMGIPIMEEEEEDLQTYSCDDTA